MTERIRCTAILYSIAQNRCVDLPPEVAHRFPSHRNLPVRVTVAGVRASTSLVARKDGGYRLFISSELRHAAGVDRGDEISLEIEPDPGGGEPELAADLVRHLAGVPGAMEALLTRSPADRRQAHRWIESAKTEATRKRRLDQLVERLLQPPRKR